MWDGTGEAEGLAPLLAADWKGLRRAEEGRAEEREKQLSRTLKLALIQGLRGAMQGE